jgi:hypothetical protein
MAGIRNVAERCLDQGGTISVREDVLGVYGDDNPQDRSVKARLDLIQNDDFVRIALVTVRPTGSTAGQDGNLQRDLDNANRVYQNECDLWLYPVGSRVVETNLLGSNVLLNQDDCLTSGHSVSDEEDDLFDLGRDMGADIVCYYINGSTGGAFGCAAHPDGRRGFWAGNSSPSRTQWTFAHELIHIVGDNGHEDDTDNLMYGSGTNNITNPPPDLTDSQCEDIEADEDVEHC